MPISGLVLTLSGDADHQAGALEALRSHPSIETGAPTERRLPIVVDTPSAEEDKAIWEWLHSLPGVVFVDLVCADHSEDAAVGTGGIGP